MAAVNPAPKLSQSSCWINPKFHDLTFDDYCSLFSPPPQKYCLSYLKLDEVVLAIKRVWFAFTHLGDVGNTYFTDTKLVRAFVLSLYNVDKNIRDKTDDQSMLQKKAAVYIYRLMERRFPPKQTAKLAQICQELDRTDKTISRATGLNPLQFMEQTTDKYTVEYNKYIALKKNVAVEGNVPGTSTTPPTAVPPSQGTPAPATQTTTSTSNPATPEPTELIEPLKTPGTTATPKVDPAATTHSSSTTSLFPNSIVDAVRTLFPPEVWALASKSVTGSDTNDSAYSRENPLYVELSDIGTRVNSGLHKNQVKVNKERLILLPTMIDASISNMKKALTDAIANINRVKRLGFNHSEHVNALVKSYVKIETRLLEARNAAINLAAGEVPGYIDADTYDRFKDLKDPADSSDNSSLFLSFKNTLDKIEKAAGIQEGFKQLLTTMIHQILSRDGNWEGISGIPRGTVESSSESQLAKNLQICLAYFRDRNPHCKRALASGVMGVADDTFKKMLSVLYPDFESLAHIQYNQNARDYVESAEFPWKDGKYLASYMHNSGGHYTNGVSLENGFAEFNNLSNKPSIIDNNRAKAYIGTDRDDGHHHCYSLVVNVPPDGIITPDAQNWMMPRWEKNNCYLSTAIIHLAAYCYYRQQFVNKGLLSN